MDEQRIIDEYKRAEFVGRVVLYFIYSIIAVGIGALLYYIPTWIGTLVDRPEAGRWLGSVFVLSYLLALARAWMETYE